MMTMPRKLLLLLLGALLCVLSAIGDDGGGDSGGVWILPRLSVAGSLGSAYSFGTEVPRDSRTLRIGPTSTLVLRANQSASIPLTALLIDPVTGSRSPIASSGFDVTLDMSVHSMVLASSLRRLYLLVVDQNGEGYLLRLSALQSARTMAVDLL